MVTKQVLSQNQARRLPQYIASLAACLGSLSTGIVMGWTGNISDELQNGEFNDIPIDDFSLGWIGSLINIGAMISCALIGKMCDWMGRKNAMLILVIPYTIGWLLIIFSVNVEMIYAGRVTTGFAGGAFCVSAPMYVAEISEKEIRGRLGTFFELLLTVGVLIAYVVGFFMDAKSGTIVLALFPILFGLVFVTQPESPIYSLKRGKDDEALKILQRLRGKHYDVEKELQQIKSDMEEDKKNEVSMLKSFKKRETKIATFVSFGLMFFQQACGVNAVIFYTSNILTAAGIDESVLSPEVSTIIVGVVQIFSNVISAGTIEKLGRRGLLAISGLFMAVPEMLLAVYFTLQERNLVSASVLSAMSFVPVLCLSVFITSAEVGYGPIAWLISAEIYPPEVRSILISAAGMFNWFVSFLVTKFYLNVKNAVGGDVTFYIFGGLSFAATVFPILFVPETKGKTLAQIQRELRGEKPEVNEST